MSSRLMTRRIAALAGGAAIVAMVGLTASCGDKEKAPATTTPTTSASVTPTEKSISPTGGNLFTPSVKAPPAPTPIPGDHS